MQTISVHEAKATLSAVLADVADREETYVVCRHGKPVADIVPHAKKSRLVPHPVMSQIVIDYDPTERLTEDEWKDGGM